MRALRLRLLLIPHQQVVKEALWCLYQSLNLKCGPDIFCCVLSELKEFVMPGNSAQLVYLFRACFLKVCCICCLLPQTAFHARPCLVGVYFKLLNVSLLKGQVVVHQSDLERWKIERIFFFWHCWKKILSCQSKIIAGFRFILKNGYFVETLTKVATGYNPKWQHLAIFEFLNLMRVRNNKYFSVNKYSFLKRIFILLLLRPSCFSESRWNSCMILMILSCKHGPLFSVIWRCLKWV